MLKNLALASVIAFADGVKLECCPTTSCCDCDGDHEHESEANVPVDNAEDSEWKDAIVDEVTDQLEVIEEGAEAAVDQEDENAIDEVLDTATETIIEATDDLGEEADIVMATKDAVNEAIKDSTSETEGTQEPEDTEGT